MNTSSNEHSFMPSAPSEFPPWFSLPVGGKALLGQGGQACVYQVIDHRLNPYSGTIVGPIAVKCYPRRSLGENQKRQRRVTREILNHRKLCHKHIVGFREVRLTKNYLLIAFNYEDGGTLFDFMYRRGGSPLTEEAARWVFQQVILAVDYSHRRNVANRDISLDNVLINGRDSGAVCNVTLCDLGFSRTKLSLDKNGTESHIGKKGYLAPEMFISEKRNPFEMAVKRDIYACGVCLYKMLLGLDSWPSVFQDQNAEPLKRQLQLLVESDKEPDLRLEQNSQQLSAGCQSFLRRILHPNPHHRMMMDEIWEDEWFNGDLPESQARLYNDCTCSPKYIEECCSCLQSEVELQYRVQLAASDFVPEGHWH